MNDDFIEDEVGSILGIGYKWWMLMHLWKVTSLILRER